jgi:hypothetical protein
LGLRANLPAEVVALGQAMALWGIPCGECGLCLHPGMSLCVVGVRVRVRVRVRVGVRVMARVRVRVRVRV